MPNRPNQHPTRLWQGRRFGVEMETMGTRANGSNLTGRDLNRALNGASLNHPVMGEGDYYNSPRGRSGTAWEVKYDASAAYEVVSPALSLDADGHNDELKRACDALMQEQPKITRQCGLHVHVDVSDFSWQEVQKLLALWTRYEPFFFSMVPESRKNNHYCQSMRGQTWAEAHRADHNAYGYSAKAALAATSRREFERACSQLGKYRTMRMDMWALNGRVEFRLHSGTVSYTKIVQWVRLMLTLAGRVKTSTMGTTGRLARTVRPLARPSGFGPSYVLGALGLGPGGQRDEEGAATTMEVYESLMNWIPARQTRFHGSAR